MAFSSIRCFLLASPLLWWLSAAGSACVGKDTACKDGGAILEPELTIETAEGPVKGQLFDESRVWWGVPYAQAGRWEMPVPPKRRSKVFVADESRKIMCPQFSGQGAFGIGETSEDCQALDIWAPAKPAKGGLLPVMVYIHGGAWVSGSSQQYPGYEWNKSGMIYVSVRYRLGTLGFFSHPGLGEEHPHSFGLMDFLESLRWVQANIERFGGDPSKVTIFGESAGGCAVISVLTSKSGRDGKLFHAIIAQSPAMRFMQDLSLGRKEGYHTRGDALRAGDKLGELYGCGRGKEALACLKALPVSTMRKALASAPRSIFMFDMALEDQHYLSGIPKIHAGEWEMEPHEIMRRGLVSKDITVMVGFNAHEGDFFEHPLLSALSAWPIFPPTHEMIRKFALNRFGEIDGPLFMDAMVESEPRSIKQWGLIHTTMVIGLRATQAEHNLKLAGHQKVIRYLYNYTMSEVGTPAIFQGHNPRAGHIFEIIPEFRPLCSKSDFPLCVEGLSAEDEFVGKQIREFYTGVAHGRIDRFDGIKVFGLPDATSDLTPAMDIVTRRFNKGIPHNEANVLKGAEGFASRYINSIKVMRLVSHLWTANQRMVNNLVMGLVMMVLCYLLVRLRSETSHKTKEA